LPSEEADLYGASSAFQAGQNRNRASVVASNVRYANGVISKAQGIKKVVLVTPTLSGAKHFWSFDEAIGQTRKDSIGTYDFLEVSTDPALLTPQVAGKFVDAAQVNNAGAGALATAIDGSLDGSLSFSGGGDCTLTGWVKLDNLSVQHIISKGHYPTDPFDEWSIGVVNVAGMHKFQIQNNWSGANLRFFLTSSLVLSTGVWYFIAMRKLGDVTTFRVNATVDTHTETGGFPVYTTAYPTKIGAIGNNSPYEVDSFTAWDRALSDGELDALYNSGNGLNYPFNTGPFTMMFQGNLIETDPTYAKPLIFASGEKIYKVGEDYDSNGNYIATLTEIFSGTPPTDAKYGWSAQNFFNRVLIAQHDNHVQQFLPTESTARDLPGLPNSDADWDGVEVFFGHTLLWKQNRLKWSDTNDTALFVPIGTTVSDVTLTLDDAGGGVAFTQPALGSSVTIPVTTNPISAGLVDGQYVRLDDTQGGITYTNYYLVTNVTGSSFDATLQDWTGATPPTTTIASGQLVFTLIANEAGEANIIGADMNGPIYRVLAQGDYAYVFKERSIHSVQNVGAQSGTFFIHPEVANEGLLSRTSLLGLGDGRIVFVGHREIYLYTGGPNLTPICQQVSREFYATLDRTRLNEIVMYHNEFKNEIWINFPIVGGSRVLIWNYFEDTATYDNYDVHFGGISALASVDWSTDPTWDSLDFTPWEDFDPLKAWQDLVLGNLDRITLMATGNGELFVANTGNNRDGAAYLALSESMDYDFGTPDNWKYVEVVLIGLQVKNPDTMTRKVYVQIGGRASLDQPLGVGIADMTNWTAPLAIDVKGNHSPAPIKVNPGGSGRYIRIRFYSVDADVEWAITSFEIHGRAGALY
jgi:hypothetical protein